MKLNEDYSLQKSKYNGGIIIGQKTVDIENGSISKIKK